MLTNPCPIRKNLAICSLIRILELTLENTPARKYSKHILLFCSLIRILELSLENTLAQK